MRSAFRIITLPFTSETIATGIGGLGVMMTLLPLIYYALAIRLTEGVAQIIVLIALASPTPLAVASISLWLGAGRRSYRDNTRCRWACELFSITFLVLALLAMRMHTA
jgi:hypothetical protein